MNPRSAVTSEPPVAPARRIGVVKLKGFYQDFEAKSSGAKDYRSTTRDVRRLIDELKAEKMDALVMDLRGNGGGHLTEATALSGLFIPSGPIVQLRETGGREYWIPDFAFTYAEGLEIDLLEINEPLQDAFIQIHTGAAENDAFNRLVLTAGLAASLSSVLRSALVVVLELPAG